MRQRKLPRSRLGRFARLARLGARAGGGKLAALLGSEGADAALAASATEALGNLRGLALKVGQMVSYVDGLVPAEQRETYERAMKRLRAAAPTMSAAAAARVVEQELGAPPAELYAEWSAEPFASASIGQVHRARTHGGRAVAVKVQFEGVSGAVQADLANVSLLGALLGPMGSRIGLKEQLAEVRQRFTEELDYRHEAARQMQFREVFRGDAEVHIPEVFDELSARRVLTTAFAPGIDFERAREAPEAERQAWAATLWRFVFQSLLHKGLFNADPHPGNYLFEPRGVVSFIDFGCTRVLSPARRALVRQCHRSASGGDLPGLELAALEMFCLPTEGPASELARGYVRDCFTPIAAPGPYRITHAFAANLAEGLRANAIAAARGKLGKLEPMPAEWVFFNRLQLGFYSVLARLDVAVDYGGIERQLVAALPG